MRGSWPAYVPRSGLPACSISRRLLTSRPSSLSADSREAAIEDFLDWRAGDSADGRDQAAEALELLLAEWGPDAPADERAFYACSPHRIQACASILRDSYEPGWVDKALPLLPGWTQ